MHGVEGYSDAVRAIAEATPARHHELASLRAYVDGTQYDGRPSWFSADAPLLDRAPCIVDPIVDNAIKQKVDLICGEKRYPDISSRAAWDLDGDGDADADMPKATKPKAGTKGRKKPKTDSEKVTEDDARAVDRCLASLESQSKLKSVAREALAEGMGVRSVAMIFGVRNRKPFVETVRAEWCKPDLSPDGGCKSIDIVYGFIDIVQDGRIQRAIPKLFRRVIDAKADTTFIAVRIQPGYTLEQYTWTPDQELTVAHGLGFTPVLWYPHMRGCGVAGRIDGHAIHENEMDEVDAYNFSLSQRHRAALYSGDPQWTEIGVQEGYSPTKTGRQPKIIQKSSTLGGIPGPGNQEHSGGYVEVGGASRKARRKGPGEVWQYPGDASKIKVEQHTLPGDALTSLDNNAKDLEKKLEKAFGVISLDSDHIPRGNVLAASAMKTLKSFMYASCDKIRSDFGDRCLLPAYGMLLRIATIVSLPLPGIDKASALVQRMGDDWSWTSPPFELAWGDYDDPDPADQQALATLVIGLREAGLCTRRNAVKILKPVLLVEDIDAYIEELDDEAEEAQQQEASVTEEQSQSDHDRNMELQDKQGEVAVKVKKAAPPKAK